MQTTKLAVWCSCLLIAVMRGHGALAAETALRLQLTGSSDTLPCQEGTLSILPDDKTRTKIFEVDLPANLLVPLEHGTYRVSVEATGCWAGSRTIILEPGEKEESTIRVWPTAPIGGLLQVRRGHEPPTELRVKFAPSFKGQHATDPSGEVRCPVGPNREFECHLPAQELDLRISAPSFAPHYFWQMGLASEWSGDLGRVQLVPGASLSGWLVPEGEGDLEPKEVKVEIVPHGLSEATNTAEERLRDAMTLRGDLEASGFFQFRSVPPGEYVLRVQSQRYAEASVGVSVVEDSASELRYPLLLSAPMKAEFVIDPPVDYYQRNWQIEIRRVDEFKSHFTEVAEGEIPATGWFETTGLNPTLHQVTVRDSWGQQVFSDIIDISEVLMPFSIEVGMVPIEGRVSLGEEPLESVVWFGGKKGATRIETRSDDSGYYRAVLPRPGLWRVELEANTPSVKRKLSNVEVENWNGGDPVRVDLALENTKVFGRVEERDGGPPTGPTIVYAVKGTWERHVSKRVTSEGTFEFVGLEEGVQQLYAWGPESRSQPVAVDLLADQERSVTLTLEKQVTLLGQVVDESGNPVPGAFVTAQPASIPFLPSLRLRTDGNGLFEATVPEGSETVNFTVSSPGRTMAAFRRTTNGERRVILPLPAEGGRLDVLVGDRGLLELTKAGRSIVLFERGTPFSEGEILWWSSIYREADWSPSSSRISFPRLAPGTYEVCLVPVSGYHQWLLGYRERGACDSGTLSYLGELELDVSKALRGGKSE